MLVGRRNRHVDRYTLLGILSITRRSACYDQRACDCKEDVSGECSSEGRMSGWQKIGHNSGFSSCTSHQLGESTVLSPSSLITRQIAIVIVYKKRTTSTCPSSLLFLAVEADDIQVTTLDRIFYGLSSFKSSTGRLISGS